MKPRDFEGLCSERIIPLLGPNWAARREWLVQTRAPLVMRAISFAPSRHMSEQFHLHAAAVPLYVPRSRVGMPASIELLPPQTSRLIVWKIKLDKKQSVDRVVSDIVRSIGEVAVPFLDARGTPARLLAALRGEFKTYNSNPTLAEVCAVSAIAAGNVVDALEIMDSFDDRWIGTSDPVVQATTGRFQEWRLILHDMEAAQARVREVAEESVRQLKLQDLICIS